LAAWPEESKGKNPFPEEAWKQTVILIAREFPGQFPDEELYNLDIRDELRWAIEARRKQILRDLSMLEMVSLSYRGGDSTQRIHNDMLNEYYALTGIDRRREEIEANWELLKIKKRG